MSLKIRSRKPKNDFSVANPPDNAVKTGNIRTGMYSARRKRTASNLFYCLFLLVVCPLSQVCVSVAGGGRGLVTPAMADFSDNCPRDCNCKWANGKREADCTRAGFTTIPTHLNHEIQVCTMGHKKIAWFCPILLCCDMLSHNSLSALLISKNTSVM